MTWFIWSDDCSSFGWVHRTLMRNINVLTVATKRGALWQHWGCSHYRHWQPHIVTNIPLPAVLWVTETHSVTTLKPAPVKCSLYIPISDSILKIWMESASECIYTNVATPTLLEWISRPWRLTFLLSETVPSRGQNNVGILRHFYLLRHNSLWWRNVKVLLYKITFDWK